MRCSLTLAAAITVVCSATAAHAQDKDGLRLTWSAPAGCPSSDEVRTATLRGADIRSAQGAGVLEADARVEQHAGNWKVRLRTRRGSAIGERDIEAVSCNGVADATALVLALALVPPGLAPAAPSTIEPSVPGPAPSGPKPASSATRDPNADKVIEPRARGPHAIALGAAIAGDASTLPATALGGALSIGWTPGRFRFEADARRWASQSQTLAGSDAGARFTLTSVGGRGCWTALRSTSFELSPCAGADVHLVAAQGYGADANRSATAQWTTVTGGALGRVPVTSWLALRARVEAFVPLSRPTFVVDGEGPVHRPPTVGAAASFGAELLFL